MLEHSQETTSQERHPQDTFSQMRKLRHGLPLLIALVLASSVIVVATILLRGIAGNIALPDFFRPFLMGLVVVLGLAALFVCYRVYDGLVYHQQQRERAREETRLLTMQREAVEEEQRHKHWIETQQLLHQQQLEEQRIALEREKLTLEREKLYIDAQLEQRRVLVAPDHTVVFVEADGSYTPVASPRSVKALPQVAASTADQAPAPPDRRLPKIEAFYNLIEYNSLQVGLGADLLTGRLLIAEILKSTHFKFVGGSDTGKSCIAGALLEMATTTNDREHLQIGLLDLEYKTCRLFENLTHVAELGPRKVRLIGRTPDEVAHKLGLLKLEMVRRARLSEEDLQQEPVLLVYIEEMLALKYEVEDDQMKEQMLADINILGVRARKYRIFLLTVMQIDYSDKSTREAMNMFRTRGGFALEPRAAQASGFFSTALVKSTYAESRQGQYVLEKPGYAGIALAPEYDVRAKVLALTGEKVATSQLPPSHYEPHYDDSEFAPVEPLRSGHYGQKKPPTTGALQADVAPLTEQEWRIIGKWRNGMGLSAIISSEYSNSKGEPLTGGDLFTQKAKEIQALIARFLPVQSTEQE
jgi:hypothetical protein